MRGCLNWLNERRGVVQVVGLVVAVLLALCFVFFRDRLVGEGARVDSADIVAMARGERAWLDDHYRAAGEVYAALGVIDCVWVVGVVAVGVMSGIVWWLHRRVGRRRVGWGAWGVEMVAIALTGYYMGALSKDVFELLIVTLGCLLVVGRREWWWVGVMAVLMLLFAWFIRPYWAVIAGLFVGAVVVLSLPLKFIRKRLLLVWLGMGVLMVVGCVVGYGVLSGEDISAIRYSINTATNLAETRIWAPFVRGGVVGGVVNSLYVYGGMFVPVGLFAIGSVWYAVAGVCFMLLFGYLLWWIWRRQGEKLRCGEVRVLALLIAYIAVASLFEPDYSSMLRHLVAIMPFMIYLYNTSGGRRQESIA